MVPSCLAGNRTGSSTFSLRAPTERELPVIGRYLFATRSSSTDSLRKTVELCRAFFLCGFYQIWGIRGPLTLMGLLTTILGLLTTMLGFNL